MTADSVTVRAAGPGDVPAVPKLWVDVRSGHASLPDSADSVERLLADRPGALLVAAQAGVVVGARIAASDEWRGNMYRLTVDPRKRRRGIALALVLEGERRLRTSGIPRITALVAHDDPDARGFSASAGYADDCEIGRFVRNA